MEQKGQRRVFGYMRVATAEQIDTNLESKKNTHLSTAPFKHANIISKEVFEQAQEKLQRARDGV